MLVFVHRGGLVGGGSFRDALATVHLVITKIETEQRFIQSFFAHSHDTNPGGRWLYRYMTL